MVIIPLYAEEVTLERMSREAVHKRGDVIKTYGLLTLKHQSLSNQQACRQDGRKQSWRRNDFVLRTTEIHCDVERDSHLFILF
jgi:hypothetical protein